MMNTNCHNICQRCLKASQPHYILLVLGNMALAYMVYMLCRVAYLLENWHLFASGWCHLNLGSLLVGGLRFDTSAIIYTNLPYIILMLVPQPLRHKEGWQRMCKWVFVVVNAVCVAVNLCDAVYSQYTGRRTTATFFREFSNEGNIGSIVGIELLHHWYLVLAGIAMVAMLWRLYMGDGRSLGRRRQYHHPQVKGWGYLPHTCWLALCVPLCIIGMRGGASTAIRPITISNANQYVNRPQEAAIVLNTPFCLIRTLGKASFEDPGFFPPSELDAAYSPIHKATPAHNTSRKNVVILIVESFGKEYIGAYNDYQGYTPFLDSLIAHSLTFRHSYANGRKSIDGMPSVLSGIPMFVEPFFLTPYSLNEVSSVAEELGTTGYSTAFFHGAENGSMGFQAYARTAGFQHYYGRTEYEADPRFGGKDDFDGTWAIWDEEFMQFFALSMSELQQPFATALFTATSHHPFVVPERYKESFHQEGHPIYTCIRYTDHALRQFFATASRQPWYRNTLFVITADHTNFSEHPEYDNALGAYSVPIIFFDPSGELPRGMSDAVAQQTDIMPTLLHLTGCGKDYIAFGKDLLTTPTDSCWAVGYNNGVYHYVKGRDVLFFDGGHVVGHYDLEDDPGLRTPLAPPPADDPGLRQLKGIIQSYAERMISNGLIP